MKVPKLFPKKGEKLFPARVDFEMESSSPLANGVGSILVNEELVRPDFAWVYRLHCNRPVCEDWKRLAQEARARVDAECGPAVGVWKGGK